MGKGQITSEIGNGYYNVDLIYNTTRADAELASIPDLIKEIDKQLLTADELTATVLEARRLGLVKRQVYLQEKIPENVSMKLYCVDGETGLAGDVGTIEIPGERVEVFIQPGYNGSAVYNAERDGQLQPAISADSQAAFYNYTILPGWQRFLPTYRIGTILSKAGNQADLSLHAATSSVLDGTLNVNRVDEVTGKEELYNVTFSYRDGDLSGFNVNDEVIIKFTNQSWDSPVIIGHIENNLLYFVAIRQQYFSTGGPGEYYLETSKIYTSTDIGSNFTEIYSYTADSRITTDQARLFYSFYNKDNLYSYGIENAAGENSAILKINGSQTAFLLPDDVGCRFIYTYSNNLYLGSTTDPGSLYKSENDGTSWTLLKTFSDSIFDMIVVDDIFYIGVSETGVGVGASLMISEDLGETWQLATERDTSHIRYYYFGYFNNKVIVGGTVRADPGDRGKVLWKIDENEGGDRYLTEIGPTFDLDDEKLIKFIRTNSDYVFLFYSHSSGNYVYRSSDLINWNKVFTEPDLLITASQTNTLRSAYVSGETIIYAGRNGHFFKSTDNGDNWETIGLLSFFQTTDNGHFSGFVGGPGDGNKIFN